MLKPVENKSVVGSIKEQIRDLIIDGDLKPGSKLPAEKELIKQLQVSRPALREALHMMVGEGLLEIRPGVGTFVRKPTSASAVRLDVVSLLLMPDSLRELQEVREILEPEVAALVSERATDKDLDEVDSIMDEMEAAHLNNESIFELSWGFHRSLARLVGNSAMGHLIDVVYELIKTVEKPLYDEYFDPMEEIADHRDLVRVFRERDPERARAAMRAHLDETSKKLGEAFLAGRSNSRS